MLFLFQGTLLDCMNMLTYLGPHDLGCGHPHTEMEGSGLWSSPNRNGSLWAVIIPTEMEGAGLWSSPHRDGRHWAMVIPGDGRLWVVVISTQRWWPSQIKCLSFADWASSGLSYQFFCLYLLPTFAYFLFTSVLGTSATTCNFSFPWVLERSWHVTSSKTETPYQI